MKSEPISVSEAADFFKTHDNFLILSHANPDGDTLGCAFALCRALQKLGKKAKNICADEISTRFDFMKEAVESQDFEPQTVVSVDVADTKLLGDLEKPYSGKIELAIDHHVSHVDFAKKLLLEPYAAAAAEPVYKLILELGGGELFDAQIAACLYTALSTDTGCFKYSCATAATHRIAAELLEYDFDHSRIDYVFFDMKTKARIALEETIYRDIEYYCDGKCALVSLTREQLESVDSEDANGLSAIPRMIEGVEVGVVFKQRPNGSWKASLRSNSTVDVQKICSEFGGGGHTKAAGCSFYNTSLADAKKQLVEVIGKALA
ncbi:MAG: bifunctional oligoribonuclease/PAP phosphatase NrnA [Ruminiclostridium sp.]|nr:bifunctional oligoribonuclease/PAP phosphatase NrnA [Ruminiclostridium sp.]